MAMIVPRLSIVVTTFRVETPTVCGGLSGRKSNCDNQKKGRTHLLENLLSKKN
jgi:hypothetical protein